MRIKRMSESEFSEVIKRDWSPIQLVGGAIPAFLQNIPKDVLHSVYASGGPFADTTYTGGVVPAGELLGGIDVYRNAPDDPVAINKDWYAVIRAAGSDTIFLVAGPIKDNEHWLDEIPARIQEVEILSVPPKP